MITGTPPYIVFRDVHVEYPGHVTGLQGISLEIQRGEFVFFVGRTGAGKSTLIKLLTREARPTSGTVLLQGRDVGKIRAGEIAGLRRGMGIVPQDFALLPRKRVWENVAYAMRAVGHSRREVRKRVPEILEQVNIAHRADAYPHELSGGEQQRVAIARALINKPPLLLADEPTGNLDPEHSWEIMELLRGLNVSGTTVLVASHDMMVIHRMGKRIVTMNQGRVVEDEPATNVLWPGSAQDFAAGSNAIATPEPLYVDVPLVTPEVPVTTIPVVPETVIPPASTVEPSPEVPAHPEPADESVKTTEEVPTPAKEEETDV